jgi:hypothetical protein
MTDPSTPGANVASEHAHVGVQAQVVHGDVIYQVPPDATAEQKFRVGANYLNGRMPPQALKLIEEAAMHGYDTWELRFHRLIGLLSGRTLRQFSEADIAKLDDARRGWVPGPEDRWALGVRTVSRLVDLLISRKSTADVDVDGIVQSIEDLAAEPREMILQHLEVFLSGALDERMWHLELEDAKDSQKANDRLGRVWIFFQPPPAGPRVRQPTPIRTRESERLLAIVSTGLLSAAACFIAGSLLWHFNIWGLIAFIAAVVSGRACAFRGLEWCFRVSQRRLMDARYLRPLRRRTSRPSDRFASGVDDLFNHYFETWVPGDRDRSAWLLQTAGIRSFMRDEIVEVYRDEKVKPEHVAWLVRHRLEEVRQAFRDGTLWAYRDQLRIRTTTKLAFAASLAIFSISATGVVVALSAEPMSDAISTAIATLSGSLAALGWLRILVERRRADADFDEHDRRKASTEAAFNRWKARLADKPTDPEMAGWLDCDRKILLDFAMRHYQVPRSRVIAHTFIELPGDNYKRARVRNGPWRYSAYKLLVFLLTNDGVHQVEADLDFDEGSYQERQRISFSYDAITAVTATVNKRAKRMFDLGLSNGQSIKVTVTDPSTNLIQEGEDEEQVSDVQWDATSLANTLRVLEGVATSGRDWIRSRDRQSV